MPRPSREAIPLPPPPDEPLIVNPKDIPARKLSKINHLAASFARSQGGNEAAEADMAVAIVAVIYEVPVETVADESGRSLARYIKVVTDEDDEPGNG